MLDCSQVDAIALGSDIIDSNPPNADTILKVQGRVPVDGEEKGENMGFGVKLFRVRVLDREARVLEPVIIIDLQISLETQNPKQCNKKREHVKIENSDKMKEFNKKGTWIMGFPRIRTISFMV